MPEGASYIDGLNAALPDGTGPVAEGDDELRQLKSVLRNTFPGATQAYPVNERMAIAMADADHTLTSAEERRDLLAFTGTLTAARNVIFPAGRQKLYLVQNSTSGGFDLLLRVGATGATFAVPAGQHRMVYTDGTNVVHALGTAGLPLLGASNLLEASYQQFRYEPSPGPRVIIERPSNLAGATLGRLIHRGNNSVGTVTDYSIADTTIDDATSGAEYSRIDWYTRQAGGLAYRMKLGGGLYMRDAVGGDKGTGTINAQSLYVNGVHLAYEQGTFTPIVYGATTAGSATYSWQVGHYTRVGNRCHFQLYVNWSGHTGTGDLRVSGLPFISRAVSGAYSAIAVASYAITLNSGYYQIMGFTAVNDDEIVMRQASPTTSVTLPMDAAGYLIISGHYEIY